MARSTLAIHWTATTHGTWLHGDPRGSWKGGRLIGPDPRLHQASQQAMQSGAERLSDSEIRIAAEAFGNVCRKGNHRVLAATVRPIHVHLVFAPLAIPIEKVVWWLKRQSAAAVFDDRQSEGVATARHLWTDRRFVVYIFDERHLLNTIEYVRRHNLEAGLPPDPYPWIKPLTAADT